MRLRVISLVQFLGLTLVSSTATTLIQPFRVELMQRYPRMMHSIEQGRLPMSLPILTTPHSNPGLNPKVLRNLQLLWKDSFNWKEKQDYINSFDHFTTDIEGLRIHFVHAKSRAPTTSEIIPIILTHGWPGTFLEFLPAVNYLTSESLHKSGRQISFDLVIPSLPGFTFSSPPPPTWNVNDTARIWNTLMVDILGYSNGYSVGGSDWGALVNWCLFNEYPLVKAAHFDFLAIMPPSPDLIIQKRYSLSEFEKAGLEQAQKFFQSGTAYFMVHQTKPWTLGLALSDSPLGQLAWIAEKYHDWSDPSLVDANYILTTASLYYLTDSFPTSLYIYAQNAGFSASDIKATTTKPFGYSSYQWEGIRHPRTFVRDLGNLSYFAEHHRGGHFAPVEVPVLYAEDIIETMAISFPRVRRNILDNGRICDNQNIQAPLSLA